MIDINELRRMAQDQEWIGRWYDAGCETLMAERNGEHEEVAHPMPIGLVPYLVAVQPAAITELLDRLEAAESALSNLGVTSEEAKEGLARHKATLARLEAAEKERELLRARNDFADEAIGHITQERDALRAKIAEMERQEPVGEVVHNGESAGLYDILKQGTLLYALPGAQGGSE